MMLTGSPKIRKTNSKLQTILASTPKYDSMYSYVLGHLSWVTCPGSDYVRTGRRYLAFRFNSLGVAQAAPRREHGWACWVTCHMSWVTCPASDYVRTGRPCLPLRFNGLGVTQVLLVLLSNALNYTFEGAVKVHTKIFERPVVQKQDNQKD